MNILLAILVILVVCALIGGSKKESYLRIVSSTTTKPVTEGNFIYRDGKVAPQSELHEAWSSGNLDVMMNALANGAQGHPVDRHFLLMSIVEEAYKQRKVDPIKRLICKRIGQMHVEEFETIRGPLKKEFEGKLPRVTTFQHLATVLTEDGEYDEAVAVCEKAIKYKLEDRTMSGFEGRIKRILKVKEKAEKNLIDATHLDATHIDTGTEGK